MLVDTETGVSYPLVSFSMTGGCGMTVLVGAGGKPAVMHFDGDAPIAMGQLPDR